MPTISIFYGIAIAMYYFDNGRHNLPHIHARCQGRSAVFSIADGTVLDGETFRRARPGWYRRGSRFTARIYWRTGSLPFPARRYLSSSHCVSEKIAMETVTKVIAREDFSLLIWFNSSSQGAGEIKVFDMRPYLSKGLFQRLQDIALFKQAFVATDTVCWPGDLDIAPETLYDLSLPAAATDRHCVVNEPSAPYPKK